MKMNGPRAVAMICWIFPATAGLFLILFWGPSDEDLHKYSRGEDVWSGIVDVAKLETQVARSRWNSLAYIVGSVKGSNETIVFSSARIFTDNIPRMKGDISILYGKPSSNRTVTVSDKRKRLHHIFAIEVDDETIASVRDPDYSEWLENRSMETQVVVTRLFIGAILLYFFLIFFVGRSIDKLVEKHNLDEAEPNT